VIGEDPDELLLTLKRLGVPMKHREVHMDSKPLLRIVLSRFFGYPRGFVDMVVKHIPSPLEGAEQKVSLNYTGYMSSPSSIGMRKCDASGPLVINIVKLFNTPDGNHFLSLGRVYSGTIRTGQQVKVLGEAYTVDDEEDMAVLEIKALYVSMARFSIEVNSAKAGNWVLIEGVDAPIKKTATITDAHTEDIAIFRPLQFDTTSAMKLAVEPLKPSELPKMVEALRRINKSYPSVSTRVEESGEHVIFGSG
jgi:116 kDa U5 small nuclear ribonucleoprotein component